MSTVNKIIEKEIIDLTGKIDKIFIDLREDDFGQELRELRHRVFNAHTEVEIRMEIAIFVDLLVAANSRDPEKCIEGSFLQKTESLVSNLNFNKKLNLYKSIKDPGNRKQIQFDKITQLNKIRVDFAHTKSRNYKKYNDRSEYKKALEVTLSALEIVRPFGNILDEYKPTRLPSK
jgi:hypothetical protein